MATQLLAHFGAPDLGSARLATEEEIGFVASLCNHSTGTLTAVSSNTENGTIREVFRALGPNAGSGPMHVFDVVEVAEDDEEARTGDIDTPEPAEGDRR